MPQTVEVSLWRGKADGHYQTFSVPLRENQTVLDVVTWVQRNADPTLAYRFACRVGMCGSCAMTVNGRPRWTCRTHISKVAGDGGVDGAGEAQIGGCGVADSQDLAATRRGGFVGTLACMAPEQITGAGVTFACDLYALGVTAFQALTGRLPFEGHDFVGQHLGAPPPRP